MRRKLAVIHYMPLEFYPPVTNLLNCLSELEELNVEVFTTSNNKNRKEYYNSKLTTIDRSPFPSISESSMFRLFKYMVFNFRCFIGLVKQNPKEILYFESYSAGPVYWYLRFFGKNKNLKIHYHEYSSREWYRNGMRLVNTYHNYEKDFLYKKADWISHTNKERVELFLKDNQEVEAEKMKILPNYPPVLWSKKKRNVSTTKEDLIRTVYIGSLSLEDTYISEYCNWIIKQDGKISFDIYAYNLPEKTKIFIKELKSPNIRFFEEGTEYNEIPDVLKNYDVGLILYKATTKNYEYNAPNKLFEYMACGLEVWFSDSMKGCYPYIQENGQKILPVNFKQINPELLVSNPINSSYTEHHDFTAEKALYPLIKSFAKEEILC